MLRRDKSLVMKKLLVIGAGIGQVNIVQQARALGVYVCVVSPRGPYPAIELADELLECDIFDRERIVEFARVNGFDAVTSDQNDLMMPTVSYVAEQLGLPGNTLEQTLSYCDKSLFRKVCECIHAPQPQTVCLGASDNPPLPWIVKPADSQSSKGVTRVDRIEQLPEAIRHAENLSRSHRVVVEECVEGVEVVCEGFVFGGRYYHIFCGDRRYFRNTLIPCQTLFPSLIPKDILQQILASECAVSKEINAQFGIVHSEYIVNPRTGRVSLLESALRGGGVYISSHLVPFATGRDVNALLLRCSLGEAVESDVISLLGPPVDMQQIDTACLSTPHASAYVCFALPEGVVAQVGGLEETCALPGVECAMPLNIQVGQTIPPMQAKGDRQGPFLIHANSRDALESIISCIKTTLHIYTRTHEGQILPIIWE